jgi:hypothetical protein
MSKSVRYIAIGAVMIVGMVSVTLLRPAHAQVPAPGAPGTPGTNKPTVAISHVQSGPDGVVIVIRTEEGQPGRTSAPTSDARSASGAPACNVQPVNIGNASSTGWFGMQAPQHPGQVPYGVYCNGALQGIVWVPVETSATGVQVVTDPGETVDPVSVAMSLLDQIQLPEMRIRFNPETGLVALASWFWVEGYDGAPIRRAATLGPITVEVEVTPSSYRWSFGDGISVETASLGKPFPKESDLRHTYERTSLGAGGAYQITVEISFAVQFRVNGGPWQPLAPIARSLSAPYPVQQAQSVLTGR